MLFRKKVKLRSEFDNRLVELMTKTRDEWQHQKQSANMSVEKSQHLIAAEKLAEAKYFFLFKEARQRKVVIK